MSNASKLVSALKRSLKARGMTYAHLGSQLHLSEASVKRIFAEENFTLERFESICEVAGVTLFEVMRSASKFENSFQSVLSEDQEEALADDPDLFVMFHLLLRGEGLEEIKKSHGLNEAAGTKLALKLDRLGLIRLSHHSKYVLLVPRFLRWAAHGPLLKKYGVAMRETFFGSSFTAKEEYVRFIAPRISEGVRQIIAKKMQQLAREIEDLAEFDVDDGGSDGARSFGVLLAHRPVEFKLAFGEAARQRP